MYASLWYFTSGGVLPKWPFWREASSTVHKKKVLLTELVKKNLLVGQTLGSRGDFWSCGAPSRLNITHYSSFIDSTSQIHQNTKLTIIT